MKTINEKNFSFKTKLPEDQVKRIKSKNKVKLIKQSELEFISDEEIQRKEEKLKIVDKIIFTINIIANIALFFFIGDMLSGFVYASGLGYNFTTTRYIGLVIFLLAQVSGIYLTIKFFLKQNLKMKLLLVSTPLTFILVAGLWVFYNLGNININEQLSASEIVGINQVVSSSINFEYVLLAVGIYLVLLYFIYGLIFKQSRASKIAERKIEK